mmetsp:Transcript_25800/g.56919  ORF Transcript_25800/g.56919 Transcript_25800/m.56919 type:complete len:157 (+) Transcript_25800:601-1071(+)
MRDEKVGTRGGYPERLAKLKPAVAVAPMRVWSCTMPSTRAGRPSMRPSPISVGGAGLRTAAELTEALADERRLRAEAQIKVAELEQQICDLQQQLHAERDRVVALEREVDGAEAARVSAEFVSSHMKRIAAQAGSSSRTDDVARHSVLRLAAALRG